MKWLFLTMINCVAMMVNILVISDGEYMWLNVVVAILCGACSILFAVLYILDAQKRDE